ncbi:MAG: hypothetical protein E7187_07840 [Erysipelotrichaceae bacterium]|nr:hypothetical protein [Erysipelotrichaceae bacterium]
MFRLMRALLLTVIIENVVLYVCKVRRKENYLLMTMINIVTNIPANILFQLNLKYNILNRYICMTILEVAVVAIEWSYIRKYMKTELNPLYAAIIVNAASFAGGIIWSCFL